MRLDHLLSKRASKGCFTVELSSIECTDAFVNERKDFFPAHSQGRMYMKADRAEIDFMK